MSFPVAAILQCPACAKIVSFGSQQTNLTICPVCWSPLLRTQDGIVTKAIAIIQKSDDFIQPGTTGAWKGNSFTVLGRVRVWFDEAIFNYWTIEFSSKEIGLLGEGYGLFSILKQMEPLQEYRSSKLEKLKTGTLYELGEKEEGVLEKKQKSVNLEIEGELWLPDFSSSFTVFDFGSVRNEKITLLDFGKDNIYAYRVDYVNAASLQLKNTRSGTQEEKNFTCTHCNKPVVVKSFPYAQSCACKECGTYYSYSPVIGFKKIGNASTDENPCILLGTAGEIEGIKYEVLGYTQKEEQNSYHSQWREYTLYNSEAGFAFLSEYDGHWIFLRETCDSPMVNNDNIKNFVFGNKEFQIFNSYNYKVINARGEFPYNIFDNQGTKCREFIAPPEIWIQERDSKEGIRWFTGRHISHNEVAQKFDAGVPYRTGIGAVQPGTIKKETFFKVVIAGLLVLMCTYFFTTTGKKESTLLAQTFYFSDTSNSVSFITEKYELNKRRSNLQLSISAPVNNSWFELSATLVNATTGKEYSLEKGIEYYAGYSDGESWAEGSQHENAYFTRIPEGTYFLQLQGTRDAAGYRISDFSVEIIYDVPNERNLWISLILFLIWPVAKYLHMRYMDTERWKNSPYTITVYDNED